MLKYSLGHFLRVFMFSKACRYPLLPASGALVNKGLGTGGRSYRPLVVAQQHCSSSYEGHLFNEAGPLGFIDFNTEKTCHLAHFTFELIEEILKVHQINIRQVAIVPPRLNKPRCDQKG